MTTPKRKTERRKVNEVSAVERRKKGVDRRRCPECGSSLHTDTQDIVGGTVVLLYCGKCNWRQSQRKVDLEHVRLELGFEAQIHGTAKAPFVSLTPEILKAAGWNLKDTLELKPLYTPGAKKTLTFVLKKIE